MHINLSVYEHQHTFYLQNLKIDALFHRRTKVLNIGGGVGGWGGSNFAGCKLIGAPAPNQCQIIIYLTLKTDNIAKLILELKSILLKIPLNKIKGTYIKLVHL